MVNSLRVNKLFYNVLTDVCYVVFRKVWMGRLASNQRWRGIQLQFHPNPNHHFQHALLSHRNLLLLQAISYALHRRPLQYPPLTPHLWPLLQKSPLFCNINGQLLQTSVYISNICCRPYFIQDQLLPNSQITCTQIEFSIFLLNLFGNGRVIQG